MASSSLHYLILWWSLKIQLTILVGPEGYLIRAFGFHFPGTRIYLFGGTSKYTGPPIGFTEEQQNNMQDTDEPYKLIDHNDLYVLDLRPSLRTLSMLTVMKSIEEVTEESASPSSSPSASTSTSASERTAVAVTRSYKIDMEKLLVVWEELPGEVRQEMRFMIENNTISRQLPLKLG